ncbi:hypothetical protein LUZ60_016631 [Juncus effusus]|nr:hypothetical protein LUZ60_016631 [Juncus effusus]
MEAWDPLRSLFLWPTVWLLLLTGRAVANTEGDALYALKSSLKDPGSVLQSWDNTLVNPCTWFHVTCDSNNFVIRVDLGNAQLSGTLVPQLGGLKNLQYLELYSNNIIIPDSLGNLLKLRFLRLNNNTISGSIPLSLTGITTLQVLDLSSNNLSGTVPSNGSFSLFTPISFQNNNPSLVSAPSPPPAVTPPPPSQSSSKTSRTATIAGGVAAVAALRVVAPSQASGPFL